MLTLSHFMISFLTQFSLQINNSLKNIWFAKTSYRYIIIKSSFSKTKTKFTHIDSVACFRATYFIRMMVLDQILCSLWKWVWSKEDHIHLCMTEIMGPWSILIVLSTHHLIKMASLIWHTSKFWGFGKRTFNYDLSANLVNFFKNITDKFNIHCTYQLAVG